jgi:hypothetical protein
MTADRDLEVYGGGLSEAAWQRIDNRRSIFYARRVWPGRPVAGSYGGGGVSFQGEYANTTTGGAGAGGSPGLVIWRET